jgi:hypothetical protein
MSQGLRTATVRTTETGQGLRRTEIVEKTVMDQGLQQTGTDQGLATATVGQRVLDSDFAGKPPECQIVVVQVMARACQTFTSWSFGEHKASFTGVHKAGGPRRFGTVM